MYVEIPENLTERTVILEFGADAYRFYQNRIEERKRNGKIYYNPLKTIYIWAAQDRKTHHGYWSTYRGYHGHGKKCKNHGRS